MTGYNKLDPDMKRWADMLVNYSLTSQTKDNTLNNKLVQVMGEVSTKPLMEALEYSILEAGGHPLLRPAFETHLRSYNAGLAAMEIGSDEQLSYVPKALTNLFNETDAFVYIKGTEDPQLFESYAEKIGTIGKANRSIQNIRLSKPWVLTLFPTNAEAKQEGFGSQKEYQDFILDACLVDYGQMSRDQDLIKDLMDEAKTVTVRSHDHALDKLYELNMEIGDNIVVKCHGKRNVPDGEVYTSPYAKTLNGEVFLDVPIMYTGTEIGGIYLKFQDGKIIDYKAEKGHDSLKAIIETDKGSHMSGEIAVGMNAKVQRALKNTLFAEKIGGTIHMAIGNSYENCYPELQGDLSPEQHKKALETLIEQGRISVSARHVDIPKDYRTPKQGEALILGDTEIVWREGKWVPK